MDREGLEVELDEHATDAIGAVLGTIGGLIGVLHKEGMMDGREQISILEKYRSGGIAETIVSALQSAISRGINEAEGRSFRLSLVKDDEQE